MYEYTPALFCFVVRSFFACSFLILLFHIFCIFSDSSGGSDIKVMSEEEKDFLRNALDLLTVDQTQR